MKNTQTKEARSTTIQQVVEQAISRYKQRIQDCMKLPDRFDAYAEVGKLMILILQTNIFTNEEKEELLALIKEVYKRED
jgi:hypothetical protein